MCRAVPLATWRRRTGERNPVLPRHGGMKPEQQLPHRSSFKFHRARDTPGVLAPPNRHASQTLKGKLSADSICTHVVQGSQSAVCQGHNRNTYVHGVTWHEPTCHGMSKSQHRAAAEGRCLSGAKAGTMRTRSLMYGRGSAFSYRWEPVLSSSPPPPALRSPPLSAGQHCTPLLPAACGGTGTAWAGEDCTAATEERVSLGFASQSLLWGPSLERRWHAKVLGSSAPGEEQEGGGQGSKLCTLDMKPDNSTLGSLLVFSAPLQVFVPRLLYRETNLLLIRWRLIMEIQALRAFIFHRVILDDFARPKFCPRAKCWFSSI